MVGIEFLVQIGIKDYIPFGIPDISYMDQFVIFCYLISSRAIFRVSGG